MLVNYREKQRLTAVNCQQELAAMGITDPTAREVLEKTIAQQGEAIVSSYQFRAPSGEVGSIFVCHNLARGAISFGTTSRWGHWDEALEILTLDESGEKFNYDGKPTYEGDEGSCSLGNL